MSFPSIFSCILARVKLMKMFHIYVVVLGGGGARLVRRFGKR